MRGFCVSGGGSGKGIRIVAPPLGGGKCPLAPKSVLAPEHPREPDPSHSSTFSIPPAPPNCSPVSIPSAPQPLAAMHVIKRGERPGRGRRVSGEQVKGRGAAAALAVGRARRRFGFPLGPPRLPALSSQLGLWLASVSPSRPPAGLRCEPPRLGHPAAFQKSNTCPLSSSYPLVRRALSGQYLLAPLVR